MSTQTTEQFEAAVAACKAWDKAVDAYLAAPCVDGTPDPTEQATFQAFEQAFNRLCNVSGVYRGVPACRQMEARLWDQVMQAVQA
jgi:hypothetical protein